MTDNIDDYLNNRARCVSSTKVEVLPSICTLDLVIPSPQVEPIPLFCDLQFGTVDEALMGETYQVGVDRVRLTILPYGYNVNKDGRFGSAENRNKISVQKSLSHSTTNNKGGSINASPGSGFNVTVSEETAKSLGSTYSASQDHHYVTALANNCWEICGPDGFDKSLRGRLIPGVALCYLTPVGQTNMKSLQGLLEIAPGSVKFLKSGNSKKKLKQHALVQALVSKRLKETGRKYLIIDKNTANFSVCEIKIEDDETS
jgi:hypothetical protein